MVSQLVNCGSVLVLLQNLPYFRNIGYPQRNYRGYKDMVMKELEQLPIPLLMWYRENARKLPWRESPTPYRVWLSEVMLQQTRVAAVLEYYRRFLEAAPTVEGLAGLPEDELMKLWQGLGYYSRARNLQKAARQIVTEHGGIFPNTYEDIRALPGVGDYTAGAIASIAFGLPTPAVDGNVLRVVSRICADEGDILASQTKKRYTAALAEVIPVKAPGDFNQAMMELGATVCLPNGAPLCEACPAKDFCRAYLEGKTEILPVKAPKKPRKVEERTVFLLFYEDKVALRRRAKKGLLAGLWEFPNEPGADLPCEWGVEPKELKLSAVGKHIFTHIEWHMTALSAELDSPELPEGWVWADKYEIRHQYAIPNAFKFVEEAVEKRLGYHYDL